ncbi:hypothetical protein VTH06DRAFT_1073 [Thermothelomyces fergusii]
MTAKGRLISSPKSGCGWVAAAVEHPAGPTFWENRHRLCDKTDCVADRKCLDTENGRGEYGKKGNRDALHATGFPWVRYYSVAKQKQKIVRPIDPHGRGTKTGPIPKSPLANPAKPHKDGELPEFDGGLEMKVDSLGIGSHASAGPRDMQCPAT